MYNVSCYYDPVKQNAHLVCYREGAVIQKLTAHEISQKSLNELFDFCLLISEIFKHLYLIEIYFKKFN